MNIRVGRIPYLNMVPFHQGFGPKPMEVGQRRFEFKSLSPRALGIEAEGGSIDAGALSLVDAIRLEPHFESLGNFGIGVRRAANSVLLFSKSDFPSVRGEIAVTDETSTSVQLLQVLLEKRHGAEGIHYGRIASSTLYDGTADALLLIGDEALKARQEGIKGLPVVTDLGEEWFQWQGIPFVFARWMVRQALRQDVKDAIETCLDKSLAAIELSDSEPAKTEASFRGMTPEAVSAYWRGFVYRLTPEHLRSIELFKTLTQQVYA